MYQDKPTGSAVFIEGINTTLLNENELAEIRKAKIGLIFQQFNLIHTLWGAIARSLVNDPGIIIGDEPAGNVDIDAGDAIMDILEALNQDG